MVMTDKGGLRVEIHDKVGAIDKLARALGMYTDKLDVTTKRQPVAPVSVALISGCPEPQPSYWPIHPGSPC